MAIRGQKPRLVSVSDTTPHPSPAPVHQLAALCSALLPEKIPQRRPETHFSRLPEADEGMENEKNLRGGQREHGSAGRGFSAQGPLHGLLFSILLGQGRGGWYFSLSPSTKVPWPRLFPTERTNRKEKPFFGISAWKHSRLVIRIFRIDSESKSQCVTHTQAGLGWVGAQGVWGVSTEVFPLSSPPSPKPPRTTTPHPPFLN